MTREPWTRRDAALMAGLALAFLAIALPGLADPARPVYDEVLHVVVGAELLRGLPPSDFAQPPLSRLAFALALWLGPGPFDPALRDWTAAHAFAWRLPALLAATAGVALAFALARQVLATRPPAVLAAALLGLDGVFYLQARLGMTNAFAVAFTLAAALTAWLAMARRQPAWLIATGTTLGLALATRWTGALAAVAIATAGTAWLARGWGGMPPAERRQWTLAAVTAFGLMPPLIYLASFVPFVLLGPEPWWRRLSDPGNWQAVVALNQGMYEYHQRHVGFHPFSSPWWSWPMMLKPQWYEIAGDLKQDVVRGFWAIGNPLLWWAAVPALALAAWQAWREKSPGLAYVAWLGFALWLPWALTGRDTTLMIYMLEVMPFAAIAIAWLLTALAPKPAARAALLVAYGGLAAAWLAWYHPFLTGRPVSIDYYARSVWLRDWEAITVIHDFRVRHDLLDRKKFDAYLRSMGNTKWQLGAESRVYGEQGR